MGRRKKEFRELSLEAEDDLAELFAEEGGSQGRRGRIFGNLTLAGSPVRAYIRISELVAVRGNRMTREEYAYYLIVDGEEIFGEERDLSHDPAVHRHTAGHASRHPSKPIAFKKFAERAEVSRLESGG